VSLDLYARAEHLLGIETATEELHELYLNTLEAYAPANVLDIGCGRGGLMQKLSERGIETEGIDQSAVMVEAARRKGLSVSQKGICEVSGTFDFCEMFFNRVSLPHKILVLCDCLSQLLVHTHLFSASLLCHFSLKVTALWKLSCRNRISVSSV